MAPKWGGSPRTALTSLMPQTSLENPSVLFFPLRSAIKKKRRIIEPFDLFHGLFALSFLSRGACLLRNVSNCQRGGGAPKTSPASSPFSQSPGPWQRLRHAFLMQNLLPRPWQCDCAALWGAFGFNALMNKAQAQGGRHQSVLTPALPGTELLISPQSRARRG